MRYGRRSSQNLHSSEYILFKFKKKFQPRRGGGGRALMSVLDYAIITAQQTVSHISSLLHAWPYY